MKKSKIIPPPPKKKVSKLKKKIPKRDFVLKNNKLEYFSVWRYLVDRRRKG